MKSLISSALFMALLMGCGSQYTRSASELVKENKIAGKTFGIMPIAYIDHEPPGGNCGAPAKPMDLTEVEQKWVKKLNTNLIKKFPAQTFIFYTKEQAEQLGLDIVSVYESAAVSATSEGVMQIPLSKPNNLNYFPPRKNANLITKLNLLNSEENVDYFIVLSNPKLKGVTKTTTTMNANGGMSSSTTTTYTSDVVVTVWDTKSGDLIYATGALGSSSGFCFFVSPIEGSIDASGMRISTRLSDVIAKILGNDPGQLAYQ